MIQNLTTLKIQLSKDKLLRRQRNSNQYWLSRKPINRTSLPGSSLLYLKHSSEVGRISHFQLEEKSFGWKIISIYLVCSAACHIINSVTASASKDQKANIICLSLFVNENPKLSNNNFSLILYHKMVSIKVKGSLFPPMIIYRISDQRLSKQFKIVPLGLACHACGASVMQLKCSPLALACPTCGASVASG